ncbi:MAG: hypothetical protein AAF085_07275 [Planctomycetota bacterium]
MGLADFFKRLGASIEVNIVLEDMEADLYPPGEGKGGRKLAELEYQRYKSGESAFEIEIKHRAGIPQGDEAVVLIHGVEVARVKCLKFMTQVKLSSKNGDEVPPIRLGDKAELMHDGVVIAEGMFAPD